MSAQILNFLFQDKRIQQQQQKIANLFIHCFKEKFSKLNWRMLNLNFNRSKPRIVKLRLRNKIQPDFHAKIYF